MRDEISFAEFRTAADGIKPSAAVILGSGLAGATSAYSPEVTIRFADVPGLAPAGVHGHAGKVSVGHWAGVPVLVFHGRLHFYEGHSWETVTGTVRLANDLGVKRIVLTNAAGGIHPQLNPGDVMLIRGHLKLFPSPLEGSVGWVKPGFAGADPPIPAGSNCVAGGSALEDSLDPPYKYPSPLGGEGLGVRVEPALVCPYSTRLNDQLIASESTAGRSLVAGIYAALTGPCYETPAEIRALKVMGADAVGMSTAMEAEATAARGLEVFGISCITNKAAGLSEGVLSHDEVQVNGALAAKRVGQLIEAVLV